MGTLLWVFLYKKIASKTILGLYAITLVLEFAVPVLGKCTEAFFLQRMFKDLLFYYCLIPLTIFISALMGKVWGSISNFIIYLFVLSSLGILWGYYFIVGGLLSSNTIVSIMRTNFLEAKEFLAVYIGIKGFIVAGIIIVIVMLFLCGN